MNNQKIKTRLTKISPLGIREGGIVKFSIEGKLLSDQKMILPSRAGYSGIAEIILEKANNVICINERDLISQNDSTYVEVFVGEKFVKKNIITGISNGILIEVKLGLKMGDKIRKMPI